MTLPRRLLGQPAWLRFTTSLGLLRDGLPQWRLQSLITSFDKVADADTEAPSQKPQCLERRISETPFQLSQQSRRNDIGRGLDLSESFEPSGPSYIGTYEFSKSAEIHDTSRTRVILLMETNIRMILFDPYGRLSEYLGLEVCL